MVERLNDEVWTGGDLLERLERRDKFFVLDVRNRDKFERFRLEGRGPVPAVNIPYFEMLELGGRDEMLDSAVEAFVRHENPIGKRHAPVSTGSRSKERNNGRVNLAEMVDSKRKRRNGAGRWNSRTIFANCGSH